MTTFPLNDQAFIHGLSEAARMFNNATPKSKQHSSDLAKSDLRIARERMENR